MNGLGYDLNISTISNGDHNISAVSNYQNGNTSRLSISPMNRTVGERRRPSAANNSIIVPETKPSLDEIIIKGRGRRSLPVKWSPIPIESPQKMHPSSFARKSPKKGMIVLRSSPRKRLQLNDPSPADLLQSRKMMFNSSPLAVKSNDVLGNIQQNLSLEFAIENTPQKDLAKILKTLIGKHPELKAEITHEIPNQQTLLVVQKLTDLQTSIFEAISFTPGTSTGNLSKVTSSFSVMMKLIENHCQDLSSKEKWESLLEFVFISWPFVTKTPTSESRIQLKYLRNQHYKFLAQYSWEALQNIDFQKSQLDIDLLCHRFKILSKDHDAVLSSLEFILSLSETEKD